MVSTSLSKKEKAKKTTKQEKIIIRVTPTQYAIILANAQKHSKGNVSKWLRDRGCDPMLDVSIEMQDTIEKGSLFDEN